MAGFKFRLQSFLGVKEKIEDQKKLEYGKALKKLDEERNVLKMLIIKKQNNLNNFKASINSGINPQEIKMYNNFIEYIKKDIEQQKIVIAVAEKNAEKKRLELVEAMKERKMLEVIKTNDNIEYTKEQLRAEQKIVDEIVSYQYNDK